MEIAPMNAVGPGSIYVPEIKPASQAERLMRIEKREKIKTENKMHEMMEAARQWAKPAWLGKNVDFYI
ncbi:MAG: hypothetical protein LBO80_03480 [Treponema sp.]|jgi:hypothetical protein|nr:hypothetical protein [Treponema sp.]